MAFLVSHGMHPLAAAAILLLFSAFFGAATLDHAFRHDTATGCLTALPPLVFGRTTG